MIIKTHNFSPTALARFRELQRLSFSVLEETAASLVGGETEKEVAHALVKRYRSVGAGSFFHLPVVLFGERTALPGDWSLGSFFPRSKPLEPGDSVILDAAPLFKGYLVDTSYSFCFGNSDAHRNMMRHLERYRDGVPAAINRGDTFQQVATDVRQTMTAAGFEPVHAKHPGEVLGHRAVKTPNLPIQLRLKGFDAVSLLWFKFKDSLATKRIGRRSPLWNTHDASDHKAHDGLWLVEPHAGSGSVGAKWEEILVIEQGQARWLDDRPPHVRQWAHIAAGENYGPANGGANCQQQKAS
ncbi:MAG: M24 family metallopeptidase [Gammaproteobacteria bacterium]|nr:M24 family metallopeptidase [Gammaproteobacteria bacterium]